MNQLPNFGAATDAGPSKVEAFTFGDPEPVLERRDLLGMMECWRAGNWYEPPIALAGLTRAKHASPHHASAMNLKRNLLVSSLVPSTLMSRATFKSLVQDWLVIGNAYVERLDNRLGRPLQLQAPLGKYVRRGFEPDQYWWVPGNLQESEFARGRVLQLRQPDENQELYGVPEYLGALQSVLLNEGATLFRRKYYVNGSHAGYILYATGQFAENDVDGMRKALKESKGPGNFRNLFIHSPEGKEKGIQVMPIAEVGAKDEFLGIKNTTRDDILAAHRVPPQLLGIVPANAGGFGDITKALDAFYELEIEPLQAEFLAINDWLGVEAVEFRPRDRTVGGAVPQLAVVQVG